VVALQSRKELCLFHPDANRRVLHEVTCHSKQEHNIATKNWSSTRRMCLQSCDKTPSAVAWLADPEYGTGITKVHFGVLQYGFTALPHL
jgi:hypothetical protein